MKKFLVLSLAAALAAGTASAQECPGKAGKECGPAKECDSKAATLTARIAELEQGAAKGCEKSQAKLDALVKAAGATDVAALKETVAACEKYAGMGCGQSKELLAKLPRGWRTGLGLDRAVTLPQMPARAVQAAQELPEGHLERLVALGAANPAGFPKIIEGGPAGGTRSAHFGSGARGRKIQPFAHAREEGPDRGLGQGR